jgi:hypothetical protein
MTVVLFSTVVVSMTGLGRVFSLIYTLEMGQRKMAEAVSKVCT